ncbi:zinc finger protein 462-like [Pempheris klunzingeri]|uniref:zinc finger protein 462-like n=1 Tax=Pempheris klunzingeri TaxID=3127111 RepID=UPI00397F9959
MDVSTSDHMALNQAATRELKTKSLQCNHCTLILKSKVNLFEHLSQVHLFDVESALIQAGLKSTGANADSYRNNSENNFKCQHCDFKSCSPGVVNEHEKRCSTNPEEWSMIENQIISEKTETKTNKCKAGANAITSFFSIKSTSKTKYTQKSSKDLKAKKRPLQIITKYFAASSGSPVTLADSSAVLDGTKGALILQESPPRPSPSGSGVFKVTAKPTIDIVSKYGSQQFLLDDHLLFTDLRPTISPPAKKANLNKEELPERAKASKQQSSNCSKFSFEFSENEDEKRGNILNGDTDSPEVYFCKHCEYSDVDITCMYTHYNNDHPYVRYNTAYIQDPSDQSANFRCLECPVDFLNVADLKRHYAENHPEAPDVFKMQSCDLNLGFKCFVCLFATNELKALEEHHKEKHPTHKVDNSLMYCRYSVTICQEGSLQLNTHEKAPSPGGSSPESPHTPCKEAKDASSPQHLSSKEASVALYHCNICRFSHKSVVVMHVHYQKCHLDEAVTIDKIKQSACVTSHTTSHLTPDTSQNSVTVIEKSTPLKRISDSSVEVEDKAEQKENSIYLRSRKRASEVCQNEESAADRSKGKQSSTKDNRELSSSSPNRLFYCQFCTYSNANVKSVLGHQNAKHAMEVLTCIDLISQYSAEVQKKKLQSEELRHEEDEAVDASGKESNAYACAENLFYCQKCNYGNPSVKGVLNHQVKVHQNIQTSIECVIKYTALIHEEIEKSKSQHEESSFSTHRPLPLMNEGDEDMFFCHFCNYRQSTVNKVVQHYLKKHPTFTVKSEQVRLHTSMVLEKVKKSHLKAPANQEVSHASFGKTGNKKKNTKPKPKLGKSLASPSMRAGQTERTIQCYRCDYSTQYVFLLKRHIWTTHKAKYSVTDVLRAGFEQGTLQTGYHCDLCVFSHQKAAALYKHYQGKHPGRRPSLEYITTWLYVGPETSKPKRKEPQMIHTGGGGGVLGADDTDGSSPTQRSRQNETKTYSCRACSFKSSSMSGITRHCRAVHPWSVKEDGSVLDVISRKKSSASRQKEDDEMSFDTYQVPLEFDNLSDSSQEPASSTTLKCSYCPAWFQTKHGLKTHYGMKHREAAIENVDEHLELLVPIQTRTHVFKCPHCTYVNTCYQGVLTHCQMKHPALASGADSLHLDDKHLQMWDDCLKRKGTDLRIVGHMCKTCPKICRTLEKLNKHCEEYHNETVANPVLKTLKSAHKLSAASKNNQFMTKKNQRSLSKASFLSNKIYAVIKCPHCTYNCSTKIALNRHLQVCHKTTSVSKALECYRCVLCCSLYFTKKRLGTHYLKKHGKESYLEYFAPLYNQVHQKPAPSSADTPLILQPEKTSEECNSSTTTKENKKLFYRCPRCPYVNTSYHGILTHCQMRHPAVIARADELQTDEILLTNMVGCDVGKGCNERGYMCKKCPLIYMSLKTLKIHCERDHNQPDAAAFEQSAESETEKQPHNGSQGSSLEAVFLKNKTSAVRTKEISFSHQLGAPEACQSNAPSARNKEAVYKCHICTYTGMCRKYLYCHYKKTHKFDAFTTYKLLQKYNKGNREKFSHLCEDESEKSEPVKCKMCPDLMFDSSQLLIAHYSTFHSRDCILDFIVLSQGSQRSTGLYKCTLCQKQMNGIRKLHYHLDNHRKGKKKEATTKPSLLSTPPAAEYIKIFKQDELPMFETVEELAKWNVVPVQTFTLPQSPLSSPSKPTEPAQPEPESSEDKHTCKQCGRRFMSLKGLRSHERSHAALAAIKKLDNLPTSISKRNINKYVVYKPGPKRPFLCSFCSYRTTVMGLWRSHFMKKHKDVIMDPAETDNQDEESAQSADDSSSEDFNNLPEPDKEQEITKKSLYLEPPDVQRQLSQYNLMAQTGATSKDNMQETNLHKNGLHHCEICNFNTGHLSSMRRHYLNRHGKKIHRCKDCNFFTGLRKTLEMHMKMGHSACQSEPTHQKDLRCPFCLYQTKNKNNMIDHIILHREERVVPIEVRRPKLSRYLQGIVFRCHKCTFTSSSAENLCLHMMRHDDIKPYKCRLCYFDCTRLSDLEAHLSDKHQVVRNHELVGQVSLDQLEARIGRMPEEQEEPLSNSEHNNCENIKTEEFVTDCNEVQHETSAENLAGNNIREISQIKEAFHKQRRDGRSTNEESPPTVQEMHEQDPQEQAGTELLADAARGQTMETIVEQNVGEGNNADVQFEDSNGAEKERQTNENHTHPRLDGSVTFTQQKEEAAVGTSAEYNKICENTQAHKLHVKELQNGMTNIEARVENDILCRILLLDRDSSFCKLHKKADEGRTVKVEQDMETEAEDDAPNDVPLLDEEGSISLAHNRKNQVNMEGQRNHMQANDIRAQKSLTAQRHLLTLHNKLSHKESSGVSFTNCKKEQVHNLENEEEGTDPYGKMPVLENEYLKEEMQPLGCCKEEDQNDGLDEMITEKNRCTNQEHEEGDMMKVADNPHVLKGTLTVMDEAAEFPHPTTVEKKLFTCGFCGRNLKNSSELECHVMRHGM